ncbi:MAG: hypothetical protein KA045_01960 [Burkholderiaceae bacterium]|jgi:hypothetical protein|nr:hypothetical protein [Burkholderiaceae bacterium]
MKLAAPNSLAVNGLVLSRLTRALLMSDVAGCVQLETDETVLIKVLCPTQETAVYPDDLKAALEQARSEGASWLAISNMECALLPESGTIH